MLRFSCVANGVCLWLRRSLRFARHKTASLTASLLLRRKTAVGPFASLVTRRRRSLLRFPCVANGVCLWHRRSLRFARHMTALLIASLLLRCIPRVPLTPSVLSLRSSHDGVAHCFASLRCKRRVPVVPSVPSLRSSQDGVAHCFASLALHTVCACGAIGPFTSLVA